jgi:hypothetical protein
LSKTTGKRRPLRLGVGGSSFFWKSHWRHLRRLIRRGFPLRVPPPPQTISATVIRNYGEGGRITWLVARKDSAEQAAERMAVLCWKTLLEKSKTDE